MSTLHCHPLYSNYAFINLLSNNLNLFLVFPIESILSLNCLVSKYLFLNTICLNFYKAYLFIVIVIVMSNLVCLNRTVQLPWDLIPDNCYYLLRRGRDHSTGKEWEWWNATTSSWVLLATVPVSTPHTVSTATVALIPFALLSLSILINYILPSIIINYILPSTFIHLLFLTIHIAFLRTLQFILLSSPPLFCVSLVHISLLPTLCWKSLSSPSPLPYNIYSLFIIDVMQVLFYYIYK